MGSPGEEASTAGRYHLYRRGTGSLQEKGTYESMAALWAVREAAGKALGIGFFRSGWQDAYVSWSEYGAPILHLKGNFKKRADELGITDMAVSITHEDGMAAAVVIMTGGTNEAAEQR